MNGKGDLDRGQRIAGILIENPFASLGRAGLDVL